MKKTICLTGASGFLGSILHNRLSGNYKIITLGRSEGCDIQCDIAREIPQFDKPIDVILHAAGKAHSIPRNESEKQAFFDVNYQGTLNLLSALEQNPPQQFIFISSVAVYGLQSGSEIDETHPLNGNTPYALSKIKAERATINWCQLFKVKYTILRLPLVVGKNPPGNLGQMVHAILKGRYIRISGNQAKKSAVLAEDIARFIPNILGKSGTFNLTDGYHPTFNAIEEAVAHSQNVKLYLKLPLSLIKLIAQFGDFLQKKLEIPFPITTDRLSKLTNTLTFSDQKAREQLGWHSNPVLDFLAKLDRTGTV